MSKRGDEIGELSLVLRDMTKALHDRMDVIERFAADVSHEIKNPLTSMRSAVETAARVKDDKSRKKLMDIIYHDVQRLDRLISDISNASRLDSELTRDEMGQVDIKMLIYKMQDAYKKPMARGSDKKGKGSKEEFDETVIKVNAPEGDIFVAGNEERLSQVFGNLITNALSFSPANSKVWISITRENDSVLISIDDEGIGIPENKLKTIFDRFYTERPNHEAYGAHSGLGLSISKQIIDAHDGLIWAENRLDDAGNKIGARFNVQLKEWES